MLSNPRGVFSVYQSLSLKTQCHQFDNFVVTVGTVTCRYGNLRCHQWRQCCQIDDLAFSVHALRQSIKVMSHERHDVSNHWTRLFVQQAFQANNNHASKNLITGPLWAESPGSLQWRHNEPDGVSNHQPHECLLNRLIRRRSKKTSKLRVIGLYAGNAPVMASLWPVTKDK